MFIICVIDLSPKNEMQRRGFIFYKNQNYRPFEIQKKNFNSFQKILIFHYVFLHKILNISSEHSFKYV